MSYDTSGSAATRVISALLPQQVRETFNAIDIDNNQMIDCTPGPL